MSIDTVRYLKKFLSEIDSYLEERGIKEKKECRKSEFITTDYVNVMCGC